jgi:hypothetical protein
MDDMFTTAPWPLPLHGGCHGADHLVGAGHVDAEDILKILGL